MLVSSGATMCMGYECLINFKFALSPNLRCFFLWLLPSPPCLVTARVFPRPVFLHLYLHLHLHISASNAPKNGLARMPQVSYMTRGASWSPSYDLRVDTQTDSLSCTYYGRVSQRTTEDWEGGAVVSLSVSIAHLLP